MKSIDKWRIVAASCALVPMFVVAPVVILYGINVGLSEQAQQTWAVCIAWVVLIGGAIGIGLSERL